MCICKFLRRIVDYLCGHPTPPPEKPKYSTALRWSFPNGISVTGENMATVMRNSQIATATLAFKDNFGNVITELGSVPAWSVSDETVATVAASADGLSAVFTPTGKAGITQVQVTVDADPGDGLVTLTGVGELDVRAGLASIIDLTFTVSDPVTDVPPEEVPPAP